MTDTLSPPLQRLAPLEQLAPCFIALSCFFIPISASLKSILLPITILLTWAIPIYRRQALALFKTIWGKALCAYIVYICVASLWSTASWHACLDSIEKNIKLLYLPFLTVFFFDKSKRMLGLNALLAGIGFVVVISLLSYLNYFSIFHINPDHVFKNHIIMGYLGACGMYIAAYLGLRSSNIQKWSYLALSLLFGFQLIWINAGRMGYILCLFLLLCLIWQGRGYFFNQLILGAFVVSLSCLYVFSPVRQERMQLMLQEWHEFHHPSSTISNKDTSIGYRLQFHNLAKEMLLARPVWGNGTASFGDYVAKQHLFLNFGVLREPHSQYWLIASEQGLIGLSLLFLVFVSLFYTLRKSSILGGLGMVMILTFCLNQLTDSMLYYSPGFFFVMLMAICLGEIHENSV